VRKDKNKFGYVMEVIWWVLKLVYGYCPKLLIGIVVIQLMLTGISFGEQRTFSAFLDSLIGYFDKSSNNWINVFILYFFIRVFRSIISLTRHTLDRSIDLIIRNRSRQTFLEKTTSLDYQQFEDRKTANLMSRVDEEFQWRLRGIVDETSNIFFQLINLVTTVVILGSRYWYMPVLLFIGEIPSIWVDTIWNKKNWKLFNDFNEKNRNSWDITTQLTSKNYIAELKVRQAVSWLKYKFMSIHSEWTNIRLKYNGEKFLPDAFSYVFSLSIASLCSLVVIKDINGGLLSIGMFTFYFGVIRNTGDYLASVFNSFTTIGEHSMYADDFRKLMSMSIKIKNGYKREGINQSPRIEFKNVYFKYPGTKKYIFKNLNLTIEPKEEIAIVGVNGAGKSSLIKLICRFYDPNEGKILINGIDLREYDLDYWYKKLSLLNQEFNIYHNLNLAENVCLGLERQDKKIIETLRKSDAYSFAKKYKKGLETMMSKRYGGEEPSWGQWQKIAIARVFYKDSEVMILDEPTAAIDAISESKIFDNLYRQVEGKTLIIVSHRFSTVRKAQRIIVIDKGEIVEEGSHSQLITSNGLYAKSFKLQASGYSSE